MSAIQCWPQLFGHPVTLIRRCWSKPGSRSSRRSTSQRANPFVSARASLQNSVPVQATVPRRKAEPPVVRPAPLSARSSALSLPRGTLRTSRFCITVARSIPFPKRSAASATARICSALIRPREMASPA